MNYEEVDNYFHLLQDLVEKILEESEDVTSLKKRFSTLFQKGYQDNLQLAKAYLALAGHLLHLDLPPIHPAQFPNGTAFLDTVGFCHSRAVPEPVELAQLGVLWMVLGSLLKQEALQKAGLKIAVWQVHLFDAGGSAHLSLWSRANGFNPSLFFLWNKALFTLAYRLTKEEGFAKLAEICHLQTKDPGAFAMKLVALANCGITFQQKLRSFAEEMSVGVIKFSNAELSFMAHLSGWNSGLFSFHKKDVAIVNAGPQVGAYDDLSLFGIQRTWDRHQSNFKEMLWEKSAYYCRLKGWSELFGLPLWVELDARLQAGQVTIEMMFQEKAVAHLEAPLNLSMVLFLKGEELMAGGMHSLKRGGLQGYKGKALPMELQGNKEKICLYPDPELTMQIIPLAGGDNFWRANFLVAFPIENLLKSFAIQVKFLNTLK